MRSALVRFSVVLFPLLSACHRESIPAVAETPPPTTAPTAPAAAALRPTYQFKGEQAAAGTGFVVKDSTGKAYFLTAAHVMDDEAEWRSIRGVSLTTMSGEPVGSAKPAGLKWIGKSFDVVDTTTDLVIWEPTFDSPPDALTLAAEDPKRNEWVWIVGIEAGRRGPQKLYRCKVTGAESGGVTLRQDERFQLRGFSGGPVLNAQGQVVGTVLGGNEPTVLCSKVSALRKRLAEAGIQLP
jgi:hypothetical protein